MRKKILNIAMAMLVLAGASAYADDTVVSEVKNTTEQVAEKVTDGTENALKATKDEFGRGRNKMKKVAKKVDKKARKEGREFKKNIRRDEQKAREFIKGEKRDSMCTRGRHCHASQRTCTETKL